MSELTGCESVTTLIDKGVSIPNPAMVEIGPEVNVDQISSEGVVLHPGTRVYGASTVISAGCQLSAETPATVRDCQLGPEVELKGGFFHGAVFLRGANVGSGAHIRPGTLLEEEAGGAHTVGLKQTILMPFVTLGSLINFCDCLMAGGTSRKNHSEVGSSYIHFNFTPDGDKTTVSLFGDVPRGVLLNQPPIFLGGQGGAVGPIYTGFGTTVGAGSILRSDVDDDNMLVLPPPHPGLTRPVTPFRYARLAHLVRRNIVFMGNLAALEAWYRQIRYPFFAAEELGELVFDGALRVLDEVRTERLKRLKALAAKVDPSDQARTEFHELIDSLIDTLGQRSLPAPDAAATLTLQAGSRDYIEAVQSLDAETGQELTAWLTAIVDDVTTSATTVMPTLFG